MKKRILAFIIAAISVMALTGCGVKKISTEVETTTGVIDESRANLTLEQFKTICTEKGMKVNETSEYDKGKVVIAEGDGIHAEYYLHYVGSDMEQVFNKLLIVCSVKLTENYEEEELTGEYEGYYYICDNDYSMYASHRDLGILFVSNTKKDKESMDKAKEFAQSIKY